MADKTTWVTGVCNPTVWSRESATACRCQRKII